MRLAPLAALVAATLVAACSAPVDDEVEGVEEGAESAFTGTPNDDIGQLFMIEHYGVTPEGYADVAAMIRTKNLGALILWNPSNADGDTVRRMVARYASVASQANRPELFVSADQEEKGTQRFKSRHGFTDLVDGATLGRAAARDIRACELHGRITAREMAAAGMNMSLGTVADLYTRDSGTPGMFRTRAIGADPEIVSSCIRAMAKGYAAEKHVVFVTKHFPGLGNASGNTDVDLRVRSYSDLVEEAEAELAPYRATIASVNEDDSWPLFGAMISHSSYRILDKSEVPATLSPVILGPLLRGTAPVAEGVDRNGATPSFQGLGFQGLTVSDAFWTWGVARELAPMARRRLMVRALLAGMDILMIRKADFVGAWDYFQMLYADQLPDEEKVALVQETGARDFASLHAKFRARVAESAARIAETKARVGRAVDFARPGEPRAASADLVDEYVRLTRGI